MDFHSGKEVEADETKPAPCSRIKCVLALHGAHQNASTFRPRLGNFPRKIRGKISAEIKCLNAPFEYIEDAQIGDCDVGHLRYWFKREGNHSQFINQDSLEESLAYLATVWNSPQLECCGVIGFRSISYIVWRNSSFFVVSHRLLIHTSQICCFLLAWEGALLWKWHAGLTHSRT